MIDDRPKRKRRIPWLLLNVAACGCWLLVPIFRHAADGDNCMRNLGMEAGALAMYAMDNGERLPTAATWMDATFPYSTGSAMYTCPLVAGQSAGKFGHAFSDAASNMDVSARDSTDRVPLIFDSSNLSWNAHGDLASLPRDARHDGMHGVAYLDEGGVRLLPDSLRLSSGRKVASAVRN